MKTAQRSIPSAELISIAVHAKEYLNLKNKNEQHLAEEEEKRKQYLKAKEYAEQKAKEVEKVMNAINYYENLEY